VPGIERSEARDQNDTNPVSYLPRRAELSRADTFFLAFIFVGLVRRASIGSPPERLGEAVHLALSTAKPKARYAVIKQRFKN